MSDIAIRVENLGKSYLVGHNNAQPEGYTALRDVIANGARNLARTTRDMIRGRPIVQGDEVEEFWALKDVSFEIKRGERVGIIGRNGAGKSTLLKILSRITEPTRGRVTINGRVASLLEVGTGFHPELTGRENIYLNGAILGMSRKEVQRKFDEIVVFAEIEKFLDTPVKRYSSGMYVRLAFSVAAHLEQEILVVDEVLAVGDARFQEKCMAKMEGISAAGRTIIFVSHNLSALRRVCDTAVLLRDGMIQARCGIDDAVKIYVSAGTDERVPSSLWTAVDNVGDDVSKIRSVRLVGGSGCHRPHFDDEEGFFLEVDFSVIFQTPEFSVAVRVSDDAGNCVIQSQNNFEVTVEPVYAGEYRARVEFPPKFFHPGRYFVEVWGHQPARAVNFRVQKAVCFSVTSTNQEYARYGAANWASTISPRFLRWTTDSISL
jgi:lipopolysaccharide transport system ATP-binding protein